MPLVLRLVRIPALRAPEKDYDGHIPDRARLLDPEAWSALRPVADALVVTDVYRSADAQLLARRRKRGVQRPGYSAHGFGLAVDLDVAACVKARGTNKGELDAFMLQAGFCCYRADGKLASESWHFTYGAAGPGSAAVERAIALRYGQFFALSPLDVQAALARLGFYRGAQDGMLGPLSREAVMAFQRAWLLDVDGKAGPTTCRTLAVVAADIEIGCLPNIRCLVSR